MFAQIHIQRLSLKIQDYKNVLKYRDDYSNCSSNATPAYYT